MLLIFDLDGTIIDSKKEIEYSFEVAFKNLGIKLDKEKLMRVVGFPLEDIVYSLTGRYDKRVMEEIRRVYYGLDRRMIRVFPGMMTILKNINYRRAILTSKKRKTAIRDLRYLGIHELFDIIVGADDVNKNKPDGEGIKKVMNELKFSDLNRIYMIGDTEVDILAAKNSGIKSIAVTWGFRNEEMLRRYKPDYIAKKPEDIIEILKSNPSVPVFSH